ncbi:alpha/beta hydrolase [Pelomonas sp. SE-A7]|uniref:alpha/beta fold hydrolase n=1 Tax=Pelomonas sp. SE-A7 TaxID=3054953 RepID=UPI00259CB3D0|nr:alpha/beta hydrolase [Pelomonas sp. SE-A7]MDM4767268.1 alpha/beta hydrolase [Pelomonas sp. SE-A7]
MPETAYSVRRTASSEFIQLRGLRHHLLRWGDASLVKDDKPLLVMLHGWMDVGASFQFVVDALARLGEQRAIVAMDWRGFGLTENSGGDAYWFPDYLGDLDALLDAISPDAPVDLLGHSMGGNVVMSFAGVRPGRIRKLINLEGFGLPETKPEMSPGRLVAWLDELKQPQQLKPYASLAEVAARLRKTNPRLSAAKADWLAPHWAREVEGQWIILGDPAHKRTNPILYRKAEALAAWSAIEAPTLWVEGDSTNLSQWWGDRYPREDFESRLAVVQNLQRCTLKDAGHMLHHDQPEALAERLASFLA